MATMTASVRSATLVETLVALSILLFIFALATTIFVQLIATNRTSAEMAAAGAISTALNDPEIGFARNRDTIVVNEFKLYFEQLDQEVYGKNAIKVVAIQNGSKILERKIFLRKDEKY